MKKNEHEIEIKLEKEWEVALDKAFKKVKKEVSVDGFRKGSVPRDIFIKKFGVESLYEEAINFVVEDGYKKALEESKLEPVCEPVLDVKDIEDKSVTLTFKIITKPEVELGEYKNLGIEKESVEVTKEEVKEELEKLTDNFMDYAKVEKAAVNGNTVVIDFDGVVEGEALEGGSGVDYPLELGSNSFIPGFEEGLIGLSEGDEKVLELKFPESYVEELKSKDVTFTVKVKEVKEKVMPEMDEDFFADLGYDDVKTEKELLVKLEEKIKNEKEVEIENDFIDKVLEKAAENMTIDVNQELVDGEIHRMIHNYEHQLEMQGLSLDMYYKMTGATEEQLHEQMSEEATKRVEFRYLIEAISDKEKVEVTDKEVEEEIDKLSKEYEIEREEFINMIGSTDLIKYDLKMRKSLEIIKDNN